MAGITTARDIVVVGGGVIGCCVAYFLKSLGGRSLSVKVVERDPSWRTASTGLSAGGIRQQFSLRENVLLSLESAKLMRQLRAGGDGEETVMDRVGFVDDGYLFLAGTTGGGETLRDNHAVQIDCGADVSLLSPAQLQERFPYLRTDDLCLAGHGERNEGWFDPYSLMATMRGLAREAGAEFTHDQVVGLEQSAPGALSGVRLASGGVVACGQVVNAAGAWSGLVASLAGVECPVEPRVRTIYSVHCPELRDTASQRCPLTVDPTGVYFRRDGPKGSGRFLCGLSPPEAEDEPLASRNGTVAEIAADLQRRTSAKFFEENIWPVLAHRVAKFESLKLANSWSGCYDQNLLDANALIGLHPETANFWFCTGFSGHGLQMSPAAGRALAEKLLFGAFRTVDVSAFGLERLQQGRRVLERNIV